MFFIFVLTKALQFARFYMLKFYYLKYLFIQLKVIPFLNSPAVIIPILRYSSI